jgi:hypothetical protein
MAMLFGVAVFAQLTGPFDLEVKYFHIIINGLGIAAVLFCDLVVQIVVAIFLLALFSVKELGRDRPVRD